MQLLKLGGSAITKKGGWMEANKPAIARLAIAVSKVWKAGKRDLIVVHGAGSFGHALVLKYGINGGCRTPAKKKAALKTHAACAALSALVVEALVSRGVPAVSVPPISVIRSSGRRIAAFREKIVFDLLRAGYLPVLYGDMVPDRRLGYSVCSGDQIIAYLGRKAERIVMVSNVDGVMANGRLVPLITRTNFPKIAKHLSGSSAADVTGGMAGKVKEIMKSGAATYITNVSHPERMVALLLGKKAVCTKIVP